MITKQAILKIELRSDLCSGSGLSYAGVIDSDVVYDEYGFPYIPARRMKGCLREAAEMVCAEKDMIERLFGKRGANAPGCLQIGNAVLERAETLEKEIAGLRRDNAFADLLTPENILGVYTSTRAQTRIDSHTGSAEDNTLRFTRVVNQYDPLCNPTDKKNLCFFADVFWQTDLEEKADEMKMYLEDIAHATRNIGMNRNRGLGSVRCEIKVKDVKEKGQTEQTALIRTEDCGDNMVKISYVLENSAPLILSEDDESGTSSHISGKSILGALAGAYLREKRAGNTENPADTDEFRDLFLNGKVKYANAYPLVENLRTYPAPLYLNKLKKTKCYINKLFPDPIESRSKTDFYNTSNGNQPKLLKTEYVSECLGEGGKLSYRITEPEKEMAYHHRHSHGEGEKKTDEQLYALEYLKSGQQFAGVIYAPKEYTGDLRELLTSSNLRFGKSRSAQYGICKLVPYSPDDMSKDEAMFCEKEEIVVTLKSDAIFMDKDGCYTVCFAEVKDLLAAALGISYDSQYLDEKSAIKTKEVVGYNTTWNMKRAAVPAVCAGSAFVYKLCNGIPEAYKCPAFVGERTQEGFGEIEICSLSQMEYEAEVTNASKSLVDKSADDKLSRDMTSIICKVLREPLIERLMLNSPKEPNKLNSSNIGRITLMLKESLDASDTSDKAATEYWKRIHSIKSEYIDEVKKIVEKTTIECSQGRENDKDEGEKKEDKEKRYDVDTGRMYNLLKDSTIEGVLDKLGDNKNKLLKEIWGEYMLQYLTQLKYECKEGGK